VRTLTTDYQVKLIGHYQTGLYVVALVFATIALIGAFYALLRRRVRRHNLAAGVLLISLLPLWLASLTVPGMSYLVTWPLLFGLLPLGWALLAGNRAANPWWRVAVLAVAAMPAIILLPGTLYQMVALVARFEGTLDVPLLGLAMLFVAPVVALLAPHFDFLAGDAGSGRRRWALPAVAGVVALALIVWGNATSGYDAEHPRPDRIAYELDAGSGQARWVSLDQHLDEWTGQFFPSDAARGDYDWILRGTVPAYTVPAPLVDLPAPEVAVLSDTTAGDVRTLRLRLSSRRGTSEMTAAVEAPGEIVAAGVDGRPLDLADYSPAREGELNLIYADVPDGGWELTLAVRSSEPVSIEIEEATDGLPGMTIQPRPAGTMPTLDYPRDPTLVRATFRF
jgi:hypothetical protein